MTYKDKAFLSILLIAFVGQGCTKNPFVDGAGGSNIGEGYHPGLESGKFPNILKIKQGDSQVGVVHTQLNQSIKIQVLDLEGIFVAKSSVHFQVASGNGTVSAEVVQTDSDGIAETSWTLGTEASVQKLKAYSESLGADKGILVTATALAATPSASTSMITSTSTAVTANGANSAQITITLKDEYNNPISDTVPTFVSTDTGATNQYSSCSTSNTQGESFCSFTSLKAETKTLNIVSPVAVSGGSIPFIHGPATHLAFVSQPGGSNAGSTFANQPIVQILDANNNIVISGADSNAFISMSLASGSGTLGGTTTVMSVLGQAIWSDLQIDSPGIKAIAATKADLSSSGGTGVLSVTSSSFMNTSSPPGIPSGLAANAGSSSVNLSWASTSGASSYNILRGTSAGSLVQIASSGINSYTDLTALNGTYYYYAIQSVNTGGTSSSSSLVQAKPLALATISSIAVNGASSLSITWSATSGADSFDVKYSTSSGAASLGITGCSTTPPTYNCIITGLTPGQNYYFTVISKNSVGSGASLASTEATGVPLGAFAMTSVSPIVNGATVSWDASAGQASYDLLYDTTSRASGGSYSSLSTGVNSGVSINSLTTETTYYFRARANNAYGSILSTNELFGTTPDTTSPTILSITSNLTDGTVYGSDSTITLTVTFNEVVTVASGAPSLALNIANGLSVTPSREAIFNSASNGTTSLVFQYTIQALDHSNNQTLDYISTSALKLNGATISDAAGNNGVVTLPPPGQVGSLSYNKTYQINAMPMVWTMKTKACGITADRTLKCWGDTFGTTPQIQNAGVKYKSTSVYYHLTIDGTLQDGATFATLDPDYKYKVFSTDPSNANRCGITTSNKLRCWGANANGNLGSGDLNPIATPTTIDVSNNYSNVSLSWKHSVAVRENGDVYCTGDNTNYVCGYPGLNQINSFSPVKNSSGTILSDFYTVYTGRFASASSQLVSCGQKNNSLAIYCWGHSSAIYGSPQHGEASDISGATNFRDLSFAHAAGMVSNCGVTDTGVLKCGQLYSSRIVSLTDAAGTTYLSSSGSSSLATLSCGVTTLNTVKCWGLNTSGQVGIGNTTSPVLTPTTVVGF